MLCAAGLLIVFFDSKEVAHHSHKWIKDKNNKVEMRCETTSTAISTVVIYWNKWYTFWIPREL